MFNKLLQKVKKIDKIFAPKILFIAAFVILNMYILYSTYTSNIREKKYFRIHVVANSDSICDQLLKYNIANKLDKYMTTLFENKNVNKETSKKIIEENVESILDICETEIASSSLAYPVYANIGNIYYDEKVKDDVHMERGVYDSLEIVIGEGKGQNWWSLIYPNAYDSIAIYEENDDITHLSTSDVISSENISYKFGIIQFFKKLFS